MPYFVGDSIDLVMTLDVAGATVTGAVKNAAGEQVGSAITFDSGTEVDGKFRYVGVYRSPADDVPDTDRSDHTAVVVAVKGSDRKTAKTWFKIVEP